MAGDAGLYPTRQAVRAISRVLNASKDLCTIGTEVQLAGPGYSSVDLEDSNHAGSSTINTVVDHTEVESVQQALLAPKTARKSRRRPPPMDPPATEDAADRAVTAKTPAQSEPCAISSATEVANSNQGYPSAASTQASQPTEPATPKITQKRRAKATTTIEEGPPIEQHNGTPTSPAVKPAPKRRRAKDKEILSTQGGENTESLAEDQQVSVASPPSANKRKRPPKPEPIRSQRVPPPRRIPDPAHLLIDLTPLEAATLIKRPSSIIKTPYVADVKMHVDDSDALAHTADLGCAGAMAPGCTVLLSKKAEGSKARCQYVMQLVTDVRGDGTDALVGANPSTGEKLARAAMEQQLIPEFGQGYEVTSQKTFGKCRVDNVLTYPDGSRLLVEVKNAVGADFPKGWGFKKDEDRNKVYMHESVHETYVRAAMFPVGPKKPETKVVSDRAIKHLKELTEVHLDTGEEYADVKTAVLFVVNRGDCDQFRPCHECDMLFAQMLLRAQESGVLVLAYDIIWEDGKGYLGKRLPVVYGESVLSADIDEDWLQRVLDFNRDKAALGHWTATRKPSAAQLAERAAGAEDEADGDPQEGDPAAVSKPPKGKKRGKAHAAPVDEGKVGADPNVPEQSKKRGRGAKQMPPPPAGDAGETAEAVEVVEVVAEKSRNAPRKRGRSRAAPADVDEGDAIGDNGVVLHVAARAEDVGSAPKRAGRVAKQAGGSGDAGQGGKAGSSAGGKRTKAAGRARQILASGAAASAGPKSREKSQAQRRTAATDAEAQHHHAVESQGAGWEATCSEGVENVSVQA